MRVMGKYSSGNFGRKKTPRFLGGFGGVRSVDLQAGGFKVGLDAFKQRLDFVIVP